MHIKRNFRISSNTDENHGDKNIWIQSDMTVNAWEQPHLKKENWKLRRFFHSFLFVLEYLLLQMDASWCFEREKESFFFKKERFPKQYHWLGKSNFQKQETRDATCLLDFLCQHVLFSQASLPQTPTPNREPKIENQLQDVEAGKECRKPSLQGARCQECQPRTQSDRKFSCISCTEVTLHSFQRSLCKKAAWSTVP